MKNYLTIIIGLILFFIQPSCTETFLDRTDPTKIAYDKFYSNKEEIVQAVNGIYGLLQGIAGEQYMLNELISDNTTVDFNPDSRSEANSTEAFEFWTLNPAVVDINSVYTQYYYAFHNINYSLLKLKNTTIADADKNESEGQLKFLRAYLYFELTQYFGDVILLTEPLDAPSKAWDYSREPQEQVYTQIENDLIDATSKLPINYNGKNIGRVTKGAALTLLGKVYLTTKQYAKATETLKQVLPLGYNLLPSYADVFDPQKKNGAESIFEVQFQGGNNLGEASGFVYVFSPRLSKDAITGWPQSNTQGWNIPTNDMVAAYEESDLRKDASVGLDFISPVTGKVVPYIKKYAHPHSIHGQTDDNWPVLRYADVLLMLAESINEQGGPTSEAYGYLNQVRQRAGLDPISGLNQQSFREKVLHERRVELAFENWRWFDLKRTKTPAELTQFLNAYAAREKANPTVDRQGVPFGNMDYVFEEHEVIFPIPYNEILVNNKLAQNPGYN